MAMPDQEYYIGVDIGGTFTDVVLSESSGEKIYNAKKLTTPANPVHGVMAGIHDALAQAVGRHPVFAGWYMPPLWPPIWCSNERELNSPL